MKGLNFNFFTLKEKALLVTLLAHLILVLYLLSKETKKAGTKEETLIALEFPEPEPEIQEEDKEIQPLVPDQPSNQSNKPSNQNSENQELDLNKNSEESQDASAASDLANKLLEKYEGKNQEENQKKKGGSEESYGGISNIYYDLPGRTDTYIPNPVYLCENGGKIVVKVLVDWTGTVVRAEVNKRASTPRRYCLYEQAIKAAYQTKFNSYKYFEEEEQGTITFIFKD
mgnify:CR=1 FL=1